MNSDVQVLANHRLNTTNIENLAADIAQRFGATVVYGTEDHFANFVTKGQAGAGARQMRLSDLREPGDDADIVVYELYDVPGTGTYNIWIFRDSFLADANYGEGQWGVFAQHFTGQPTNWNALMNYRRTVNNEVVQLGGDTAIYYAEDGDASFAAYDAEENTFASILGKVQLLGSKTVAIDNWLSGNIVAGKKTQAFIDTFTNWQLPDSKQQ
jgi:hypothetical protein